MQKKTEIADDAHSVEEWVESLEGAHSARVGRKSVRTHVARVGAACTFTGFDSHRSPCSSIDGARNLRATVDSTKTGRLIKCRDAARRVPDLVFFVATKV